MVRLFRRDGHLCADLDPLRRPGWTGRGPHACERSSGHVHPPVRSVRKHLPGAPGSADESAGGSLGLRADLGGGDGFGGVTAPHHDGAELLSLLDSYPEGSPRDVRAEYLASRLGVALGKGPSDPSPADTAFYVAGPRPSRSIHLGPSVPVCPSRSVHPSICPSFHTSVHPSLPTPQEDIYVPSPTAVAAGWVAPLPCGGGPTVEGVGGEGDGGWAGWTPSRGSMSSSDPMGECVTTGPPPPPRRRRLVANGLTGPGRLPAPNAGAAQLVLAPGGDVPRGADGSTDPDAVASPPRPPPAPPGARRWWTLPDLFEFLRDAYCGTLAVETTHVPSPDQRRWLRARAERVTRPGPKIRRDLLFSLRRTQAFERQLEKKFPSSKRFSVEGLDAFVPAVEALARRAGELGVKRIELGMAHRGRLALLHTILGKPFGLVCTEMDGQQSEVAVGDVKYHSGEARGRRAPAPDAPTRPSTPRRPPMSMPCTSVRSSSIRSSLDPSSPTPICTFSVQTRARRPPDRTLSRRSPSRLTTPFCPPGSLLPEAPREAARRGPPRRERAPKKRPSLEPGPTPEAPTGPGRARPLGPLTSPATSASRSPRTHPTSRQ